MGGMEQWEVELREWWHHGIDYAHQIPDVHIYSALVVVILTTVLVLTYGFIKRTRSNTIVLTGLSGSGKTIMFYQLRDGSTHKGTVTSMEPNEGTFILHSEINKGKRRPVHLVDVPGHHRLRHKVDEFLPRATGIVFFVDALDFLPNLRASSEFLYDVLTNASVIKKKIPILICCNKTDKVTAHSKDFIRKQLEKEIEKLRETRKSLLDSDDVPMLGFPGQVFNFSQCSNRVTIAESSGLTGEVSELERFIRALVKP